MLHFFSHSLSKSNLTMLLPTSHFPPLTLAFLILVSTSCWSSSSGQKHLPPSSSATSKSGVVGIRSHGVATINPEQKSNLERGNNQSREQSLAKALRHIEEADPDTNNVVDNSLLPRTRSRLQLHHLYGNCSKRLDRFTYYFEWQTV